MKRLTLNQFLRVLDIREDDMSRLMFELYRHMKWREEQDRKLEERRKKNEVSD